ncbi:MAG: hypothetical protein KDA32_14805 [Phycisphaerales bacterium]|nr:hypothetical protein [Phycisphaerales bacterium]
MSAQRPTDAPWFADAFPESRTWTDDDRDAAIQSLPARPALCLLVSADGEPILLLTGMSLRRIVESRMKSPAERRADLQAIARGVHWRIVDSAFEARWRHYDAARRLQSDYRDLIGFGPVHFLHVDLEAPIPDIRVSNRVFEIPGAFAGPFRTNKAAQAALEGLWDLFDLCRYPEQVRRAPHGKRCAYFDMGRCDGPCDGTVGLDVYRERVRTAWSFATGAASKWIEFAQEEMKAQAAALAFEAAAATKARIETATRWASANTLRTADDLRALLLIPVARRRAWSLARFDRGELWFGGTSRAKKLVAEATAFLAPPTRAGASPTVRKEQTWLFARFVARADEESVFVEWLDASSRPGAAFEERLATWVDEQRQAKPSGQKKSGADPDSGDAADISDLARDD